MTNAWHDVDYGEKAPKEVKAYIEVPMGSRAKYEIDKKSGLIILDRVLYSPVMYPGDYGFIPQTLWDDGDPLDIIILSYEPVIPGCLCYARPIGMLRMIDNGENDNKIIAVHSNDPRFDKIKSIKQLPPHQLKELKHFFQIYKELQNKKVDVLGFRDAKYALLDIKRAINLYKKQYKQN